jgi:hypothetical protein
MNARVLGATRAAAANRVIAPEPPTTLSTPSAPARTRPRPFAPVRT